MPGLLPLKLSCVKRPNVTNDDNNNIGGKKMRPTIETPEIMMELIKYYHLFLRIRCLKLAPILSDP